MGQFTGERFEQLKAGKSPLRTEDTMAGKFRQGLKGEEPKEATPRADKGQLKPGKHFGKASGRKGSRKSSR